MSLSLTTPCPKCRAKAEQWCVTGNGHRTSPHTARNTEFLRQRADEQQTRKAA